MAQLCAHCGRANPDEAVYCYRDGGLLAGHRPGQPLHTSLRPFPRPLSFPSGQQCLNFEQLLRCCQDDWTAATQLLRQGEMERFFIALGRIDLARLARAAATAADPDRGLDELLGRLPSQTPLTPRLRVTPQTLEVGKLAVGEERLLEITLHNDGARLLCGTVTSNQAWLTPGESGTANKVFQFSREQTLALWVRGQQLSASHRRREAQLSIESNAGSVVVTVLVEVPPQPFPHGALAGADSPRQLVDKIRHDPQAAAELFDSGSVADWYRRNGWPYPVAGPSAAGLDSVRQFFKALGLPDEFAAVDRMPAVVPAVGGARPFREGVLAGALNPGQLTEAARAQPREAAPLFESGAVAAWYQENGWPYPVTGPCALGVDAVHQFLKAVERNDAPLAILLTPPPIAAVPTVAAPIVEEARPKTRERVIQLRGRVGEQLRHVLSAKPKKGAGPLRAQASSDQPWLDVGATKLDDTGATIVLVVPAVPDRPGETLNARVRLTVNDNQNIVVPVTLLVVARPEDAGSALPVST
ncbi:MAG TPA: hypothetical protein VH643_01150 [Gemmataceae bacterium]|jgi:hypothetical protein